MLKIRKVVIVVAKYKENVDWVRQNQIQYLIYDKDGNVPNVGRESDTFLRYIIQHYKKLPDHVIFLQGSPFEHLRDDVKENIFHKINFHKYIDKYQPFYPAKIATAERVIHIDRIWGPFHGDRNLGEFSDRWFYNRIEKFTFPPGAQAIIPRKAILFRCKLFYEKLKKCVDYDRNPLEGHFMERMWPIVFDKKTKDRITHAKDVRQ